MSAGVAGSQRMEKGGWLVGSRWTNSVVQGSTTAPSAATKEVGWRITGQENTAARRGALIDNGDCRL